MIYDLLGNAVVKLWSHGNQWNTAFHSLS